MYQGFSLIVVSIGAFAFFVLAFVWVADSFATALVLATLFVLLIVNYPFCKLLLIINYKLFYLL